MTKEEFTENYANALDAIIAAMAEEQEIDPDKFYSMICVLENLRFFSPVLYAAIRSKKK
ncbi:hypothetical protein [Pontibacter flavimaris]|uniref:hypothetical protein n=1 Tax=Pontibacter flavimaris TaxID=1797110 RepID=UPI00148194EA|nr:hypothetical protein [Pontibacter flavimaris]